MVDMKTAAPMATTMAIPMCPANGRDIMKMVTTLGVYRRFWVAGLLADDDRHEDGRSDGKDNGYADVLGQRRGYHENGHHAQGVSSVCGRGAPG